jgi:hypothetical protein
LYAELDVLGVFYSSCRLAKMMAQYYTGKTRLRNTRWKRVPNLAARCSVQSAS